jgi:hypothetical protein
MSVVVFHHDGGRNIMLLLGRLCLSAQYHGDATIVT